jgi:outer membrane lipoprotein SlyB
MKHAALAIAGFVAGGIAAGAAYERLAAKSRDRLDIYFDDGSFVTYVEGSPEAEQLLPLAREVLVAVTGAGA